MDTDRNLLFAVLALQTDLLSRERFVQACTLWAGQKDRPIADLLVQQGWLAVDDRSDLERLLDRKLHKHGGDAGASLAAVTGAEARGALAAVADAEVERSLAALPGSLGHGNGKVAAEDISPVTPEGSAGRNVLYEEIGRGGMGRVLRGRDPDLRRDLAVKVLREEYRDDATVARRFVEEAQIGGQLQHPGIVPVYELGRFADRRPFFTMKLIKGRTLAELLKERNVGPVGNRHADMAGWKPAPQDLSRFLGIFAQVCQTVAYAHSKRVIHRDLKPSNIMVGAFGEVQVMDWGLAKVLGERDSVDPEATTAGSLIRTARSGSAEEDSRTGVVGTPAYMAPEQARGEVAVDERADVFGLGGILCIILTGQPPYTGADREELLRQAAAGDVAAAFARLEGCGADVALVALARTCLAPERANRPRDAGEVAARVAAYAAAVQERLRAAELERAAAEARAEEAKATAAAERKARQRTAGMAVALLLLALGGGVGAGQWQKHQADAARRDAQQRQTVEFALEKATGLSQQAHWREASAVLEQARQVLGDAGSEDLRQRLDVSEAELKLVNRLDGIRQRFMTTNFEGRFDIPATERDYATAFREAGLGEVGDDVTAVASRVRATGVSGALVAALDDWATMAKEQKSKSWLLGVARRAMPDPWGDRFRDPAVWRDRKELQALADEALRDGGAKLEKLSPQLLGSLGLLLLQAGADAVPLLRAAQRRYPSDFSLSLFLGSALGKAKQAEEAVGYSRVAVALRPDCATAHNNLGTDLYAKKDVDGAIVEYRKAIDLDPELALSHCNLGAILNDYLKDHAGAIAEFRKAIDLDPKNAGAHFNLGNALHATKDVDGAITEFRKAIDLDPKLAGAHNNLGNALYDKNDVDAAIAEFRKAPKLAQAHINLGKALRARKDLDGAIAEFRKAIDLDPKLVLAHMNLGSDLWNKKDVDGAIAAYRRAIDLDPALVLVHGALGDALYAKKDVDGAVAEFRKAIDLDPKYAPAHISLGIALRDKKDVDGAIAEFRKAINIDPKLVLAHINLASALYAKKDVDGAIAEYRKAIDIDPKYALVHGALGEVLYAKKDVDAAIAEYRKAIDLDPKLVLAHCNLGIALHDKKDVDGAIAEYRKAIDIDTKYANAHNGLGIALRDKKDVDGAIAEFRAAIQLKPAFPEAHCNLGHILRNQGQFAEALESLRRGHALGSATPGWPYPSADWVRQCEHLVALDEKLPAILNGEAEPADAAERIALAQLCQQYKHRHAAAARFYADAFAADPKLAADPRQRHRYNAACSAALAAAGQAEDAKNLPDKVQRKLRRQALGWLRADLAVYAKMAQRVEPAAKQFVRQRMTHWQEDTDLASVRDKEALGKLPDDERKEWRQLWDDVVALLKKVEETK